MNAIERARYYARKHCTNTKNGFGTQISLKTIVKSEGGEDVEDVEDVEIIVVVGGHATHHHTSFDEYGNAVNASNSSIAISIDDLKDKDYPFQNSRGEITFKGHTVQFTDAHGSHTFHVSEWMPDENLGLITLMLGE